METFEAEDIQAAVEMAERFKREGRYDWFRGQTQPWPPYSSAMRLHLKNSEAAQEASEVYNRFEDWVHDTPGLESLAADENAIMAVAQHHGLATFLIDFTTEPSVAGFFAVDGVTPDSENSCIYCLNTQTLIENWAIIRDVYRESGKQTGEIECIQLSIPHLWRLEAQAGVFLFANNNWDSVHRMDRILFRNAGYPSYPTKEEMYPPHKSPLELLLDHYFELESRRKRRTAMKEFVKQAGLIEFNEATPDEFFHPQYFVPEGPPILESWGTDRLGAWLRLADQTLVDSRTVDIRLDVDLNKEPTAIRKSIAYGVERAIGRNPELRKRSVRWVFGASGHDPILEKSVAWLWAGLRALPFGTSDIADGIGVCVAFHKAGLSAEVSRFDRGALVESIIGPAMVVEFGSVEGNGGKGLVGTVDLRAAVRSDIRQYLDVDHQKIADNTENLLIACFNPRRLFEFDALASLFARQIAPAQVLTEQVITFSPARLLTFGIP